MSVLILIETIIEYWFNYSFSCYFFCNANIKHLEDLFCFSRRFS